MIKNINSFKFKFKPTKHIFYCKNNTCHSKLLKDATTNKQEATVDNNIAYIKNNCFGSCKMG